MYVKKFSERGFWKKRKVLGEDEFYQKWKSLDYMKGIEINKYQIRVTVW
jgi:hypothetical protein